MTHQSDSSAQRAAEIILLKKVAQKFDVDELKETTLSFGDKSNMKFDACFEKEGVVHLFEVFTRLEKPKAAQDKKVKTDILKMWGYQQFSGKTCIMHLVFPADQEGNSIVADYYTKRSSWICELIKKLKIETLSFALEEEEIKDIQKAVNAQRIGMKTSK